MYDDFSELPGFTAVKQNGLYIGIEDPDFGVTLGIRDTYCSMMWIRKTN